MPFKATAARGAAYNRETHLIKAGPIPNLPRVEIRKGHSMESKALAASNDAKAQSSPTASPICIICALLKLLEVLRPGMNPD
ncbi:hypothetical protein GDO81_013510 [Engystomops pustulosus]|uniref:Uncharacterized protein n=1 Tax=Engystomops pustulosus TaxID=76066 RepID=A0AAV7B3X9_ENGPU|nr:hypothetical protein GDO81_013510 [Engystomops pustulosus]